MFIYPDGYQRGTDKQNVDKINYFKQLHNWWTAWGFPSNFTICNLWHCSFKIELRCAPVRLQNTSKWIYEKSVWSAIISKITKNFLTTSWLRMKLRFLQYTANTKRQSKEWYHSKTKKIKQTPSRQENHGYSFLGQENILLVEFKSHNAIINVDEYCTTYTKIKPTIQNHQYDLLINTCCLVHENITVLK